MQHIDNGNVGIPVRSTLDCNERAFIYDETGCTVSVGHMESLDRVAMSVLGDPENIATAVDMARHFMDYKIRIDACMQYGGSYLKNKPKNNPRPTCL